MSNILLRNGPFVYKRIFSQVEDKALELLANAFSNHEPINRYLKTPQNILERYFYEVLNTEKSRELSVVCIHEPTQELCGVKINNSADALIKFPDNVIVSLGPIYQIIDEVSSEFLENNKGILKYGCHVSGTGVSKKWAGHKIGYYLFRATYENAKELGYKFGISESTGPISQHIYVHNFGSFVLKSVVYKDIVFNGEKVLNSVEGDCKLCLIPFNNFTF